LLVAFSEMDVVFNFITLFFTSDYYKDLIFLFMINRPFILSHSIHSMG
jgi:hypothetical protein